MKNKFQIKGDVTEIYITRRNGETFTTLVDTEDLEKIQNFGASFHINGISRPSDKQYVCCTKKFVDKTKKDYSMHRIITDCDPDKIVDHINHDGLDNRKSNLRIVTHAENCMHKKGARSDSSTGVQCVHLTSSGRYMVRVMINGFNKSFGTYATIEEAEKVAKKILEERQAAF